MNDDEIMKNVRCCADHYCKGCSLQGKAHCRDMILAFAWDAMYNQKAKNEALQMENAQLQSDIINANQSFDHIKGLWEEEKEKVTKAKQKVIESCMKLQTAGAEIERLKADNVILSQNAATAFQDGLNEAQALYAEQVKAEIRAEARKEFANFILNEAPGVLKSQTYFLDLVCEMLSKYPEDIPTAKNEP